MERTQKIKIQRYKGDVKDGKPTVYTGTLDGLRAHLFTIQHEACPPGKKRRPLSTQNKTKDKKLGMGFDIWISDEKIPISHNAFWPVNFEKPKHIK